MARERASAVDMTPANFARPGSNSRRRAVELVRIIQIIRAGLTKCARDAPGLLDPRFQISPSARRCSRETSSSLKWLELVAVISAIFIKLSPATQCVSRAAYHRTAVRFTRERRMTNLQITPLPSIIKTIKLLSLFRRVCILRMNVRWTVQCVMSDPVSKLFIR